MEKIQNWASGIFIAMVAILTTVSTLGIWDFFGKDVINKSLKTFGILALVAIVVIIASKFFEGKMNQVSTSIDHPEFRSVRKITVGVLIAAVSILALIGVMSIWELLSDKNIVNKSIVSVILLAFSASIVIITCLIREGGFEEGKQKNISVGTIIIAFILLYFLLSLGGTYFY